MILGMWGIGIPELIVISIVTMVYAVIPVCCWQIVKKTGYPAWWSLGILLPVMNIVLLIMLAFTEWPVERNGPMFDEDAR